MCSMTHNSVSWKEDTHHRATFRGLCQYFRSRSFALGTLEAYELPLVYDGPSSGKNNKGGKDKGGAKGKQDENSANVKEGKKKPKSKKTQISPTNADSTATPSNFFDLTGKASLLLYCVW